MATASPPRRGLGSGSRRRAGRRRSRRWAGSCWSSLSCSSLLTHGGPLTRLLQTGVPSAARWEPPAQTTLPPCDPAVLHPQGGISQHDNQPGQTGLPAVRLTTSHDRALHQGAPAYADLRQAASGGSRRRVGRMGRGWPAGNDAESQQHRHVQRADPGVEVPVPVPVAPVRPLLAVPSGRQCTQRPHPSLLPLQRSQRRLPIEATRWRLSMSGCTLHVPAPIDAYRRTSSRSHRFATPGHRRGYVVPVGVLAGSVHADVEEPGDGLDRVNGSSRSI